MGTFSIKQLQERYGVGEHTVLGWIHSGLLRAIDISRVTSSRPKWRITPEDLEAFEMRRSHKPPEPRKPRKSKKPERMFYK
jgi:transposase